MASNVDITWNYLRRKGLTPAQAAGVIGVMQGESGPGLSTTAKNPSSGAYGIAQWLGGRKTSLLRRGNANSIRTQLDHLWSELQGPERGAYSKLKGAKSIDQAVNAWLFAFERPGAHEANLPARTANARRVFSSLSGKPVGSVPGRSGSGSSSSGPSSSTSIKVGGGTETVADPEAQKRVILANLIKQSDPQSLLLKLGILNPDEPTTKTVDSPSTTVTTRTGGGGGSSSGRTASVGGAGKLPGIKNRSPLFELFWQGQGGINAKQGKKVAQGFVSGHKDHVHVAAGPNTVVALGKLARGMGLYVGENPHFGGVAPVHVKNSYHYRNEAIDVSGDPRKMQQYAHRVARLYGIK